MCVCVCRFIQLLLAAPEAPDLVGPPTVFVSHAWQYCFLDVVEALCAFAEGRPGPVYFWFDCVSIDEHATQTMEPDFWDTTFKAAIRMIGHTVMLLSPWDKPVPLTRSWCLWEAFCTHDVGAGFSVCLPATQREAFRKGNFHLALCNYLEYLVGSRV